MVYFSLSFEGLALHNDFLFFPLRKKNPSIHAQLIFSYQDITWADQLLEWNPTPGFVRGCSESLLSF
jgi:hypothetical protein